MIKKTILFVAFSLLITSNSFARLKCPDLLTSFIESNAERVVTASLRAAGIILNGSQPHDIRVIDRNFYKIVLTDPELKLGETYMDGLWESDAIDQLVYRIMSAKQDNPASVLMPLWRAPHLTIQALLSQSFRYFRNSLTNRQTRTLSKNVAEKHYDAGNDLYRLMLDPTMTYTSGIWSDGYTLEDAQNAKYDLICRKLGLKPGDHVLDIGSGFGGFARFAAKNYGARVTGITISVEQLKLARELSADFDGVDFIFSDYRDIPYRFPKDTFDHIVSIEMIEAVGIKNLNTYFAAASASLKTGGRFLIQAIASPNDVVGSNPWFSKYIFQDGVAPSNNQVDRAARAHFGQLLDRQELTHHYDRTLLEWHKNFSAGWSQLKDKYSPRFKRMWDFYLLSVAGGFRARRVRLYQTVFLKDGGLKGATDIQSVRTLPSMTFLQQLRQTEIEKERTKDLVAEIEEHNSSIANSIQTPRRTAPFRPLDKSARIAVVGAGPGGLSAALELQNLGYNNVLVLERNPVAGGKSHTIDFAGRPHDLGATMGIRFKYDEIIRLATRHNQRTIPFPEQVNYDLSIGGPAPKAGLRQKLNLGFQALVYMVRHNKMMGKDYRGLEVPPDELVDPWQVVMDRHNLSLLGDRMKTYLTGYGYGGPDTPAVFAHRMLDVNAILGSILAKPIMWENGTQPIWTGVARQLNVLYNTSISRIDRSNTGVKIYFSDGRNPESFDKLILAVDPHEALRILNPTQEERSVFSQVQHMPYATFAVRVNGLSEGRSEVGYLRENMNLDRQGHPMAWIKRYPDDNLFIFHLFAPKDLSDEDVMHRISMDMKKLGATDLTLIDSRRWPFFPHVDAKAIRENKFFERALRLQGLNNTVFVNEVFGMSTMPDAATVGRNVAQRLASGEYGND